MRGQYYLTPLVSVVSSLRRCRSKSNASSMKPSLVRTFASATSAGAQSLAISKGREGNPFLISKGRERASLLERRTACARVSQGAPCWASLAPEVRPRAQVPLLVIGSLSVGLQYRDCRSACWMQKQHVVFSFSSFKSRAAATCRAVPSPLDSQRIRRALSCGAFTRKSPIRFEWINLENLMLTII